MAIDLPPAIPPQLVDMNTLMGFYNRRPSPVFVGSIGKFRMEVIGYLYLDKSILQRLLDAAATPSQFIQGLNTTYHRNGNLLVRLLYLQRNDTVYVYVVQSKLESVTAPAAIRSHFTDLIGEKDLTLGEFEKHRVLAGLKSERQGVDYTVSYRPGSDVTSLVMDFSPVKQDDFDASSVYLDFGNQGNRFVGRYFAGTGLRHDFDSGAEIKLDYQTALVDLGDADGGKSYHGGGFHLDYPSSAGLYGLETLYSTYRRELLIAELTSTSPLGEDISGACLVPGSQLCAPAFDNPLVTETTQPILLDIEGESLAVALNGEQVVFSSSRHRMTFTQRLEGNRYEVEDKEQGVLIDEAYGLIGLGAKYLVNGRPVGAATQTSIHLFAKAGLSGDSGTLGTDTTPGIVSIGKRTAEFAALLPKFSTQIDFSQHVRFSLDASAQFSDDQQLPEMQQYVLGGISLISAYLPGVLIGDSGTYVRAALSGINLGTGVTVTPSVFIENGRVWFEDTEGTFGDVRAITDAGIRLNIELGEVADIELVAARSVSEENLPEQHLNDFEANFFGRIRVSF